MHTKLKRLLHRTLPHFAGEARLVTDDTAAVDEANKVKGYKVCGQKGSTAASGAPALLSEIVHV